MPYIRKEQREYLDGAINELVRRVDLNSPDVDGRINYVITKLLLGVYGSEGYSRLMRAVGTLECVKQEYYRRVCAPYEEKKKVERGDVYTE